jgi:hypothetical protein
VFQHVEQRKLEKLPVCSRLARRGFYLPSGIGLQTDEIELVAARVRGCLG